MTSPKKQLKTKAINELIDAFDYKFFKTLSEPVRVQILKFILFKGKADIGTIAENLPQDRSVISRHLNIMYEVGILTCNKENRHVYYEINGDTFINKFENLTDKIRKCMPKCCPKYFRE